MKLEVGMYVRTLKGVVKIEKILDGVIWDTQGHLHFGDFVKASHNIIDLIEVGDYVNGELVTNANDVYTEDNIYIGKEVIVNHEDLIIEEDIESIVTKEQFEEMQYMVGE